MVHVGDKVMAHVTGDTGEVIHIEAQYVVVAYGDGDPSEVEYLESEFGEPTDPHTYVHVTDCPHKRMLDEV